MLILEILKHIRVEKNNIKWQKVNTLYLCLPGQTSVLHDLISLKLPEQSAPPYFGCGLSHFLFRVCVPPPHDLEHVEKEVQFPQSPSTTQMLKFNN